MNVQLTNLQQLCDAIMSEQTEGMFLAFRPRHNELTEAVLRAKPYRVLQNNSVTERSLKIITVAKSFFIFFVIY